MPVDPTRAIPSDDWIRILSRVKKAGDDITIPNCIREHTNSFFLRTMNQMIYDREVEHHANTYLNIQIVKSEFSKRFPETPHGSISFDTQQLWTLKQAPLVLLPTSDFSEKCASFAFSTFYTKDKAMVILARVHLECRRIAISSAYYSNITKNMRMDEFNQVRSATMPHTTRSNRNLSPVSVCKSKTRGFSLLNPS